MKGCVVNEHHIFPQKKCSRKCSGANIARWILEADPLVNHQKLK
jgi:hypothetical protein